MEGWTFVATSFALLSGYQAYEICSTTAKKVLVCEDNSTFEGYCCPNSKSNPSCCYRRKNVDPPAISTDTIWYYVIWVFVFISLFAGVVRCLVWKRNRERAQNTAEGEPRQQGSLFLRRRPQPEQSRTVAPSDTTHPEATAPPPDEPPPPLYNDEPPSYSEVIGEGRSDEYKQLLNNYVYSGPEYQSTSHTVNPTAASSSHN